MGSTVTDEPLLRVENLHTEIRTPRGTLRAVDSVSFDVARGEVVGIVGESGCGKSMTALSILRLEPAAARVTADELTFGGRDILTMSNAELRSLRGGGAGLVFQDPMTSLNPVFRVGVQIGEALRAHQQLSRREAAEQVVSLLRSVHVPSPAERARDYPHRYSGGMRQRAIIAMALANEPELLIADEPTTALDVTVQAQVMELIRELIRQYSMSMILITHNMALVASLCSRVIVMYAGRIVEEGPTQTIFDRPQHPYTWSLLRSIPRLDMAGSGRLSVIEGLPPDLADPPSGCKFHPRCPFRIEQCMAEEPKLKPVGEAHDARCWVLMQNVRVTDKGGQTVAPPGIASAVRREARPIVRAVDVVRDFAVAGRRTLRALDGVNLEIVDGETLGLVGETGCGKSTLGRVIVGLQPVSTGHIYLGDVDTTHLRRGQMRRLRREMQIIFQDPYASLNPRMQIGDIISEPLRNFGVNNERERVRRTLEIMALCGLGADLYSHYPHEFSGGMRQRVGIARALVLHPRFVVADEPVSALDVSIQAQIINLLKDLQEQLQLTYLFIAHDLAVVRHIAHRVAIMYLGKVVEVGQVNEIYSKPLHPYTTALLSSIPLPDPQLEARRKPLLLSGEIPSPLAPPSGCRFHTRCPIARFPLCREKAPPLAPAQSGRLVACHFPGEADALADTAAQTGAAPPPVSHGLPTARSKTVPPPS